MHRSFQKVVAAFVMCGIAPGADISAVGGWTQTITVANLTAGAGSDLPSDFDSISGATTISVLGLPSGWNVLVRRGSGSFGSGVQLFVRRTSNGSPPGGAPIGSISGGESFIEVTGTDTVFFSGSSIRNGIGIQYRLTGISCTTVTPATYSAPIIFTVQ